jgi:hypothetical protein
MSATVNDWAGSTITERRATMLKPRVAPRPIGETRLHPARGILTGLAMTLPFWVVVGVAIYELI